MQNPEEIAQNAVDAFEHGYSCSQSVLSACGKSLGLNEVELLRLAAGLGAGLGGLRETCGAVTAMASIIGYRMMTDGEPLSAKAKAAIYTRVQEAVARFEERFKTHNCLQLLKQASIAKQAGVPPEARTADYYAKRPCAAFVRFCAAEAMR